MIFFLETVSQEPVAGLRTSRPQGSPLIHPSQRCRFSLFFYIVLGFELRSLRMLAH